jgi:hypothetical protein
MGCGGPGPRRSIWPIVAAGRLDGYWERGLAPWDLAAGVVLVEEAGGVVSGYDGQPFDLAGRRVIACAPGVAAAPDPGPGRLPAPERRQLRGPRAGFSLPPELSHGPPTRHRRQGSQPPGGREQPALCDLLAEVYRLWGYQEVAPPTIERLATLGAGGAIAEREVIRLVAEEPLGLRPELTASIARAASTRMVDRPRPLRLWACGTTFGSFIADGGGQRISERLQSGVELLGAVSPAADRELMHLLLAAVGTLGLRPPTGPPCWWVTTACSMPWSLPCRPPMPEPGRGRL